MKKLLLIVCAAVLAVNVQAQEKGTWVLFGSVGLETSKDKVKYDGETFKSPTNLSLEIAPGFRYFVSDRWAIGLGLGYGYDKEFVDYDDDDKEVFGKTSAFTFKPEVTYFLPLGGKFYYTPSLYVGAGFGNYKQDDWDGKTNVTLVRAGLSLVSFEFKPVDKVGIALSAGGLQYDWTQGKDSDDDDYKEMNSKFGLNLNIQPTITLSYYFGK